MTPVVPEVTLMFDALPRESLDASFYKEEVPRQNRRQPMRPQKEQENDHLMNAYQPRAVESGTTWMQSEPGTVRNPSLNGSKLNQQHHGQWVYQPQVYPNVPHRMSSPYGQSVPQGPASPKSQTSNPTPRALSAPTTPNNYQNDSTQSTPKTQQSNSAQSTPKTQSTPYYHQQNSPQNSMPQRISPHVYAQRNSSPQNHLSQQNPHGNQHFIPQNVYQQNHQHIQQTTPQQTTINASQPSSQNSEECRAKQNIHNPVPGHGRNSVLDYPQNFDPNHPQNSVPNHSQNSVPDHSQNSVPDYSQNSALNHPQNSVPDHVLELLKIQETQLIDLKKQIAELKANQQPMRREMTSDQQPIEFQEVKAAQPLVNTRPIEVQTSPIKSNYSTIGCNTSSYWPRDEDLKTENLLKNKNDQNLETRTEYDATFVNK